MTPSSTLPRNDRPSGRRRFLPHPIPLLFVAAFVLVVAVNGALIYFSENTFSGLETEHAYERGLQYNQALAGEAAQEQLGWRHEALITDGTDNRRELRIRLTDRDGRPLDGLKVEVYLVRPSSAGMDLTLSPKPEGDGRYVARFELPALGQWDLRLVAKRGDAAWQQSDRLFVK